MLQKDKLFKRAKDIRVLLNQRLILWEAEEVDILINNALSSDKRLNTTSKRIESDSEMVKRFNRFMLRGKVRDAMNCLNETGRSSILHPSTMDVASGKSVLEILQDKHPVPIQPDESMCSLPEGMI